MQVSTLKTEKYNLVVTNFIHSCLCGSNEVNFTTMERVIINAIRYGKTVNFMRQLVLYIMSICYYNRATTAHKNMNKYQFDYDKLFRGF